jgi:hypothetical protein
MKLGKVTHDKEKHTVTIEYDHKSTQRSSTGKTFILATTGGFQSDGDIGISINITRKTN